MNQLSNYEEVADAVQLDERTKPRFIRYMRTRWAKEEKLQCATGYTLEWARRFEHGDEFACSDFNGQMVLEAISKNDPIRD